jgi:hypothetical protein
LGDLSPIGFLLLHWLLACASSQDWSWHTLPVASAMQVPAAP